MASRKTTMNYLAPFYHQHSNKTTHLNNNNNNNPFEFNEADLWTSSQPSSLEPKNPTPASRIPRKPRKMDGFSLTRPSEASSLPVNIPDWSKIMGGRDNNNNNGGGDHDHRGRVFDDTDNDEDDDDDENGLEDRLPPHEYVARKLARSRIVSFSVHEGVGRTLKGRDLSRVRNVVWKQTGFED